MSGINQTHIDMVDKIRAWVESYLDGLSWIEIDGMQIEIEDPPMLYMDMKLGGEKKAFSLTFSLDEMCIWVGDDIYPEQLTDGSFWRIVAGKLAGLVEYYKRNIG